MCRKCIQGAGAASLGWKLYLREVLAGKPISILERKISWLFGDVFSAGLFELLFKGPDDHFEEKKHGKKFLVY